MPRGDLFLPVEPFSNGYLPVAGGHLLYWEECGNPRGVPILFLHGGPGAGSSPSHRRFFDPGFWRAVLFDQRGSGRSRPLASIDHNTPDDLVADIETLREQLGIERWYVFGGSWGSTLALLYAQEHPDRVAGLLLRGVFTMRQQEIDWFLYGMGTVFPDAARRFREFLPAEEQRDLLNAYYHRLTSPDPRIHMPAARSWSRYEAECSTLLPSCVGFISAEDEEQTLALARLEAHYFKHCRFTPEDRLLRGAAKLRGIPATIVQGRYDVICPMDTAYELHRRWPQAEFVVVPDAGHSAMEPGIRRALVQALDQLKMRESERASTPLLQP